MNLTKADFIISHKVNIVFNILAEDYLEKPI